MALHWKTLERLNRQLEDMVDQWHDSQSMLTLAQFLRMDWPEYTAWTKNPKMIPEDWESREEGWGMHKEPEKETIEA